jgi:hypothetical protein
MIAYNYAPIMNNYLYQNNLIAVFQAVVSRFISRTGYILAYAPMYGGSLHDPRSAEQEVNHEEH